ncbi:MAG TPA: hypothetical protein VMY37_19705 [Thermoguttaceae bacterium]|nr:hypothetical protein [Thermoguttaceae bacterium]
MQERRLYFNDVFDSIPGGDILLWRAGWRPWSWVIARGTRSIYSHVAMTAWWQPATGLYYSNPLPSRKLVLLDTLQWQGGRRVELEPEVLKHSGRWDWYHVLSHVPYNRRAAVIVAGMVVGQEYGWEALIYAAIRNASVMRWLLPPDRDDEMNGTLPHCAAAVSAAMRAGGLDPVVNCANRSTLPGDFERSAALEYQGTLYWEET